MKKDLKYYLGLNYRIIVEEVEGVYEAYIKKLGRWTCTAAGETEGEAVDNLVAHKDCLIEDWYKRGEYIPEPACCSDYEDWIDVINNYIVIDAVRTGTKGYKGPKFRFCPWCGEELEGFRLKDFFVTMCFIGLISGMRKVGL